MKRERPWQAKPPWVGYVSNLGGLRWPRNAWPRQTSLHPTPDTLHPTPYTLHPTPDTRHPTPDTRHLTSWFVLVAPLIMNLWKVTVLMYSSHPRVGVIECSRIPSVCLLMASKAFLDFPRQAYVDRVAQVRVEGFDLPPPTSGRLHVPPLCCNRCLCFTQGLVTCSLSLSPSLALALCPPSTTPCSFRVKPGPRGPGKLTLYPKPQTPNPKYQTPNTKHQTPNTKHQTPNAKH